MHVHMCIMAVLLNKEAMMPLDKIKKKWCSSCNALVPLDHKHETQGDLLDWYPEKKIVISEEEMRYLMTTREPYQSAKTTLLWKRFCRKLADMIQVDVFIPKGTVTILDLASNMDATPDDKFLSVILTVQCYAKHLVYDKSTFTYGVGDSSRSLERSVRWYGDQSYDMVLHKCFCKSEGKRGGIPSGNKEKVSRETAVAVDNYFKKRSLYVSGAIFSSSEIVDDLAASPNESRKRVNSHVTIYLKRLYVHRAVIRWWSKLGGGRKSALCYRFIDGLKGGIMMQNISRYDINDSPMLRPSERESIMLERIGKIERQLGDMCQTFKVFIDGLMKGLK